EPATITEELIPTEVLQATIPPTRVAPTGALTELPLHPKTLADRNLGISFEYAADWTNLPRAPEAPSGVTLRAPPVGNGPEPIIFAITVDVGPSKAKTVSEVIDENIASMPADARGLIQRQPLTVAGEPAEQVIGLPSRSGDIET